MSYIGYGLPEIIKYKYAQNLNTVFVTQKQVCYIDQIIQDKNDKLLMIYSMISNLTLNGVRIVTYCIYTRYKRNSNTRTA